MCVKAMTNILQKRIRPASGATLLSYVYGYLQQEASCIIGGYSVWVFRSSRKSPENHGCIPSIKSNYALNTMSLSDNGVISSNHFSREDIL